MKASHRPRRGVSLIEALVAMAVMGIGTLAVLGLQTTLRANADISKQRGEAVRIAQEEIERLRSYQNIDNFAALTISSDPAAAVELTDTNASYTLAREVVTDPPLMAGVARNEPASRALRVTVAWEARGGANTAGASQIRLSSVIHATPRALAGSLLVSATGAPTRTLDSRHPSIPADAIAQTDGTSSYTPPGAPVGVRWVFDNLSGVIRRLCSGSDDASCVDVTARLLSGQVRFATVSPAPPGDPGEVPTGYDASEAALVAGITVAVAVTEPASSASCYTATPPGTMARVYSCAVRFNASGWWTGQATLAGMDAVLAADIADLTPGRYRVCRYTPYRNSHPLVPTGMRNDEHPLRYVQVTTALLNQNYLVRRAADDCPTDGPEPLLNTNTWHHQPSV